MRMIGLGHLTCHDIERVARRGEHVGFTEEAMQRIKDSRGVVDRYVEESRIAYGITTGVGKLCNTIISSDQAQQLQTNISRSHACGIGDPLSEEETRSILLVRLNQFALGYSGISWDVVQTMMEMLNLGLHPVLPRGGGVGSSGSLSTGAHMALAMTGEGRIVYKGEELPATEAFKKAGLQPVVLGTKECLSLINGTHVMCGIGALAVSDLWTAIRSSEICAAVSLEALIGNTAAFDIRVQQSKAHKGQIDSANNILCLIEGSELYHLEPANVQDAYAYRCTPQVMGGARELLDHAQEMLENEINSAADNPIVLSDADLILSCGNFHGQVAGLALDLVAMAAAVVAKISERRISRMVDPQSSGLPAFLVEASGINSGFMIPQYIAASLTSEIKLLANPAATDSIPTSGGQEDVVSNGTISANKARQAAGHLFHILGIEALCAAQAMDLSGRRQLGKGTQAAYASIRGKVDKYVEDRIMEPDILAATRLIETGTLIQDTEEVIGILS